MDAAPVVWLVGPGAVGTVEEPVEWEAGVDGDGVPPVLGAEAGCSNWIAFTGAGSAGTLSGADSSTRATFGESRSARTTSASASVRGLRALNLNLGCATVVSKLILVATA